MCFLRRHFEWWVLVNGDQDTVNAHAPGLRPTTAQGSVSWHPPGDVIFSVTKFGGFEVFSRFGLKDSEGKQTVFTVVLITDTAVTHQKVISGPKGWVHGLGFKVRILTQLFTSHISRSPRKTRRALHNHLHTGTTNQFSFISSSIKIKHRPPPATYPPS